MKLEVATIDRTARKQLESVLRQILRCELTGRQIHDLCDPIPCDDDTISSITHLLDCIYAGWEEVISVLNPEARATIERCASFLTTDLPIAVSSDKFLTKRRFWFDRFDTDGFLGRVRDGIWPFASEEQMRKV